MDPNSPLNPQPQQPDTTYQPGITPPVGPTPLQSSGSLSDSPVVPGSQPYQQPQPPTAQPGMPQPIPMSTGQPGMHNMSPQQPKPMMQPAATKSKLPLWIKIVCAGFVIFIILAVFVGFVFGKSLASPQKISDQFLNDMQSGNKTDAYSLITSSFKQEAAPDVFGETVDKISPFLQGEEKKTGARIEKQTGSDAIAVFVYAITRSDGSKFYVKTELQKDGNDWRVLNFRTSASALETTVE